MKPTLAIAVLATAACASPQSSPDFDTVAWTQAGAPPAPYLFGPGDVVEVTVPSAPELSRTVEIAPNGQLSLPLAGSVLAAGRSSEELRRALSDALSYDLIDPDVTLTPISFGSQQVFVGGEVASPGVYALPGRIDALQAIILAGGLTDRARARQVVLMRRSADGELQAAVFDVIGGVYNSALAKWGPLKRFDVVYVPQTPIAKQNRIVRQYIRDALPLDFSIFLGVADLD
ncbi:MAG: polysaccharide biosynthesis/export family protein [Pseudomonadota bacterium]